MVELIEGVVNVCAFTPAPDVEMAAPPEEVVYHLNVPEIAEAANNVLVPVPQPVASVTAMSVVLTIPARTGVLEVTQVP